MQGHDLDSLTASSPPIKGTHDKSFHNPREQYGWTSSLESLIFHFPEPSLTRQPSPQTTNKMADIQIGASSWRQIEVGRVLKLETGSLAVIVEIIDHKRVRLHNNLQFYT